MDKTAIKNFAVRARRKLIEEITHKAYEVGITRDKIHDIEIFEGGFRVKGWENGKTFKKYELKQREILEQAVAHKGFDQVIEEVAYTWFNRFIALRFMEVKDYLPTGVRVLSSVDEGKTEPDIIREALNIDLDIDPEIVYRLQDGNDTEDLYRYLLVKQCNQLGKIMPSVFEEIADYTELLLPDKLLAEGSVIRDLVESIEEYDWKIELDEKEQELEAEKGEHGIEIIGWLYQYYISEKKDEVFANLRQNIKITKENIPAATQLFTPKWIVKYMVENSLGRLWLESHPNDELKAKWQYYLEEAEQEPEVQKQLDELKNPDLNPEEIKILDPAMGSGHILVYAFDVLYDIYLTAGYSEREIPTLILEKNLYGLDIDDRAGQLASFALLMKARSKNRRIFRNRPELNLCSNQESNNIPKEVIDYLINPEATEAEQKKQREEIEYLIDVFHDAKEYGSILKVKKIDFETLEGRIEEYRNNPPKDILELQFREVILEKILPLIKQAKIMSQKYDVVCTNPPYMGRKGMNPKLVYFLDENFKDSKTDLFAVFTELSIIYLKNKGFTSNINQHSWMFLSSFEKLRGKIVNKYPIYNMIHLGPHAFEEIGGEVVQSTCFVIRKINMPDYKGVYVRLVDWKNAKEKEMRLLEASSSETDYKYLGKAIDFTKIPGSPVAYWASEAYFRIFETGLALGRFADVKRGMTTSDNNRFLRFWPEVSVTKIFWNAKDHLDAKKSNKKWFPYSKGGGYRKWYGFLEFVVNWENGGSEVIAFAKTINKSYTRTIVNMDYYFKPSIGFSYITAGGAFSMRWLPSGFIYDSGGPGVFAEENKRLFILGCMNSKPAQAMLLLLNPTINLQIADVVRLPLPLDYTKVYDNSLFNGKIQQMIQVSKDDWDSFETSWGFKKHPLLTHKEDATTIEEAFKNWVDFAQEQFNQLKANEEELNRIFIEIYGLQDELTPDVNDNDVTVTRIYNSKEDIPESMKGNNYVLTSEDVIKSFISYAVGCMFGRYSLDEEGLIYAGGDFSEKFRLQNDTWEINTKDGWRKSSIPIAKDNVIPIADGDYFEDDILERFVEFVKVAFGEENLEENLQYIGETLGMKANETARQAIRRYFLKDFYQDHVRTYKKRPIYWLFDSGKQNGFKALIYLHRYDPFTVARVRTDYLHRLQRKYEAEVSQLDIILDSQLSTREKAVARKRKEDVLKKMQECLEYDQAIAHVANQKIKIDLDDGVKVNYAKFQGVEIPQGEGKKSLKANLLAKI